MTGAAGQAKRHDLVARLTIRGRMLSASFLDFAADRARRFSLDGWAALDGPGALTIVAAGPEALIDMLEVACMLGPIDAFVDEIERGEEVAPYLRPPGFTILG